MSELLEEQVRDELVSAALAIDPPSHLLAQVKGRLRQRARRRGAVAGAALVTCGVIAAVVGTSSSGASHHTTPPVSHHSTAPKPAPITPAVVHGPPLTDTMSGQTLRAIRTVVLPGGRTPISGMTVGDVFYANSTLTNGIEVGKFQRLVRVNGRSGQVVMAGVPLRAPTTPVAAYGEVWVADRHRLVGFDATTLAVRTVVRLPGDLPSEIVAASGYLWVAGWTHLDRIDPSNGALMRIAPASSTQRFAGVAANNSGQFFTGISHLPDITANIALIQSRNPVTGDVLTVRSGLAITTDDLAGVAGRGLWLSDSPSDTSGHVDRIDIGSLALFQAAPSAMPVAVTVSNGVPWVSGGHLSTTADHSALFECLSASTGAALGQVSLRQYPGVPASKTPGNLQFFAAGPNTTFVTVDQGLVIYPADSRCSP